MSSPSVDYDAVESFSVDPNGLVASARKIKDHTETIIDSLLSIENTLDQLSLGWAGRTADEARDFGRRWQAISWDLFGTEEAPERGVLAVIASGVGTVGDLFAKTEHSLVEFFDTFGQGLVGGGAEGESSFGPRDDITDIRTTAVTQDW
ncbi:WXG100 family type VII secretion target [Promicromonospora sukumoe]|uniref:WXG100 family type VII secretion target n=1 Tax=Promicromonospora sukumoe TaxID=88382 RepID=UPI0037C7E2E2